MLAISYNVFISTSIPKIKIRVESDMPFIKSEKKKPSASDSSGSESSTRLVHDRYIFGSKDGSKAFTIEKLSFLGPSSNWYIEPIDYSQKPGGVDTGKFNAGNKEYSTGIFITTLSGQNYLHKYYSRLIGDDIRLVFSFSQVSNGSIEDSKHLTDSEWKRVRDFSRMADNSFEILP